MTIHVRHVHSVSKDESVSLLLSRWLPGNGEGAGGGGRDLEGLDDSWNYVYEERREEEGEDERRGREGGGGKWEGEGVKREEGGSGRRDEEEGGGKRKGRSVWYQITSNFLQI